MGEGVEGFWRHLERRLEVGPAGERGWSSVTFPKARSELLAQVGEGILSRKAQKGTRAQV